MSSVSAVGSLGETDFLNLMMTELQNQDPMNPVSDTDFISELAQFSSLEASTNTATAVGTLSTQQTNAYATSLLGKTASGTDSTTKQAFSGTVTGVDISGSAPKVYINGSPESLADIQQIS